MNERPEACAIRETREETGIGIENPRFVTFTNDIFAEAGKHYVTLFFVADWKSGEVQLMEPEMCHEWKWSRWDSLPKPLFSPTGNFVETRINPLEI